MQIYFYNSDDFDSLSTAIKERRIIAAMAVFFQVKIFFDFLGDFQMFTSLWNRAL